MDDAYRQLKGFRVYCDESNTDSHKRHPVYGAILVSLDNILEVRRELKGWRRREDMHGELAWTSVAGGLRLKKYKSLVDLLFRLARQRRLMHFKAIVMDTRAPEYVLMGAIGYHCQDFHLCPKPKKEKLELARYIAARLGLRRSKARNESHQGRREDRALALE